MSSVVTTDDVITLLGLEPHPEEGGWFLETYRSSETTPGASLPSRYGTDRAHATAIYYLLNATAISAMHKVESDEVFHFYLGDPVEQVRLYPDGSGEVVVLGPEIAAGQQPQAVVARGVWQGARVRPGGDWALLGATVAPGFDYRDYTHGDGDALARQWPEHAEIIRSLATPPASEMRA